jgi:hypothetical protein
LSAITGNEAESEAEWNAREHSCSKKTYMAQDTIGIYEETLEVSAGEVTGNDIGDAPMLPGFLNLIPPSRPDIILM